MSDAERSKVSNEEVKPSTGDSSQRSLHAVVKPSVKVSELLDVGDIYELYGYFDDETYLVRTNMDFVGTLIDFLGIAIKHIDEVQRIEICAATINILTNQSVSRSDIEGK